MKLSAYRGEIVVLYLTAYYPFPLGNRTPSAVVAGFGKRVAAFKGKPVVFLGVTAWYPDEFRKEIRDSGLPLRFWRDQPGTDRLAGPIHSIWDAHESTLATCYVLDHRGKIRYKLPNQSALIEKAVTRLLEEPGPAGPAD